MSELRARHCTPCRPGTPALSETSAAALLGELDGWTITDRPVLARTFRFPDFASALAFVNAVGRLADAEDHHPDVHLSWGQATVELWTHAAGGLTENDFILAAKIDAAFAARGAC